ncbi:MAG: prepilin-type N-terminal cleavage/methylation domain-containing protein, partial [Pirellulales bacterium]
MHALSSADGLSIPVVGVQPSGGVQAASPPGSRLKPGRQPVRSRRRGGFTLVEVLIATALTLVVMGVTVTLFGNITGRISGSRAIIETNDRLRSCRERLILDLRGITAPMLPPLRPEWGLGYFEYVEGDWAADPDDPDNATGTDDDSTVGDVDDVVMFTTRSSHEPFIGRNGGTTALSQVAEVAWFMRGTTLYRRVLLVLPTESPVAQAGYYGDYDISVRQVGGTQDPTAGAPGTAILVANSLGDLTKRENRYGHHPRKLTNAMLASDPLCGYPHGIGRWGQLGLPTLRECSDTSWPFPWYQNAAPSAVPTTGVPAAGFANLPASVDYWRAPHANGLDPA